MIVVVDAVGAFANRNAGDNKEVVLDSSYAGVDIRNYSITDQVVANATITPAALAVSGLTADDKVYDGPTVASINDSDAVFTGLFAGDVLSVDVSGNFSDKNVADNKVVTLDSSYTGADAGIYQITDQATVTADITPAMLLVSGITANDNVYDTITGATVVMDTGGLGGLVGGAEVMVAATGSFADKHVGEDKTVSLNSNYTGSDAGNYTITGQTTATADITTAELLISGITANNKIYDSTTRVRPSTTAGRFTQAC